MKYYIGIDPGNEYSAYCITDEELRPLFFGKRLNELMFNEMVEHLDELYEQDPDVSLEVAIEMIASYGMPVGKEVFETCLWIGKLLERFRRFETFLIYRKEEKMDLCHSMQANDATIRQALIDRFASGVSNHGKGTKKEPGWFYGFRADVWASYAVAVTHYDKQNRR